MLIFLKLMQTVSELTAELNKLKQELKKVQIEHDTLNAEQQRLLQEVDRSAKQYAQYQRRVKANTANEAILQWLADAEQKMPSAKSVIETNNAILNAKTQQYDEISEEMDKLEQRIAEATRLEKVMVEEIEDEYEPMY